MSCRSNRTVMYTITIKLNCWSAHTDSFFGTITVERLKCFIIHVLIFLQIQVFKNYFNPIYLIQNCDFFFKINRNHNDFCLTIPKTMVSRIRKIVLRTRWKLWHCSLHQRKNNITHKRLIPTTLWWLKCFEILIFIDYTTRDWFMMTS